MTRKQALDLLHKNMTNQNLRRHCYAVEAVMGALYRRLEGSGSSYAKATEDLWSIAGLLHDADYELTKDNEPKKNHTKQTIKWLKELEAETDIYDAIAAHAWGYVDGAPEPKTKMQSALYCCDELTGLIVAVALVKDKKLANVTVDAVLKKFPEKKFAAGVNREQIAMCKEKLKIELPDFIMIALRAMQNISRELEL